MKRILTLSVTTVVILTMGVQAAFLIEIDTDGADDGTVTYNPNFAFGGDTTTASQSSLSTAFGMNGGDSIFGGNGVGQPDTYVFTYDPSVNVDNLVAPAGTLLGGGDLASGMVGGAPGTYAVYATWPTSANVSGGPTNFTGTTSGDSFAFALNQTAGDQWFKLGEIDWTSGAITISQSATTNSFVSMRGAGVLVERIPEPSATLLLALGAIGIIRRRRG